MDDVFISYARSTERWAEAAAAALRALGYSVWRDDSLPAHRVYAEVIETHLRQAKAVLVLWSAEALSSHWVRAEADVARQAGTLVQLSLDGVLPPLPFNLLHCAFLGETSDLGASSGWSTALASIRSLVDGDARPRGALEQLSTPTPTVIANKPSLAILPFANLTRDPEQDFFADGMVEELATAMSRIKAIMVIAGASSRALKGADLTPIQAAAKLGVRYLLEGSVRKAGDRVRISVALIDATVDARIWSDRFDGTLEDVFALQDQVALAVTGVIGPAVQSAEILRVLKRPTQAAGSYDLYLRALSVYQSLLPADVDAALDLLREAIALDPNNAPALGLAANCHGQALILGSKNEAAARVSEGLDFARRSLQAAPDDSEVLSQAATALWHLGEDLGIVANLAERSISLNPGSARALSTSGWIGLILGQSARAIEALRSALRLDPISSNRTLALTGLGLGMFCEERYEEAVALAAEARQLRPGILTNYALMAACYGYLDRPADARRALADYRALSPEVEVEQWFRLFHKRGDLERAIEGLRRAEAL